MDYVFPCTPQGGSISQLYPACYSTRVYIGGIYVGFDTGCVFCKHD